MNRERLRGTGGKVARWWLPPLAGVGIIAVAVAVLLHGELGAAGDLEQGSGLALGAPTAEEAFSAAAALADQNWPDAEIAVVSSHWARVGEEEEPRSAWEFQFFSSSTQRLILIGVSDGEARLVRDSLSPYAVPTFSRREWRVDSDEAIQIWWDEGGSTLIQQRPDADVVAQLRVSDDYGGQLVWVIGGLASGQEDLLMTVISGVDGRAVDQG